MSSLRPECKASEKPAMSNIRALDMIRAAVLRRRTLSHGVLDDTKGGHCAMGWFWHDHPGVCVTTALLDEVAAVNDSVPPDATPRERWQHVSRWLRWKTRQ